MITDITNRSTTIDTTLVINNIKLSDFCNGKVGVGANVGIRNDKIDVKNDVDVRVDKIPVI